MSEQCEWWNMSVLDENDEPIGPPVASVCKEHLVFERSVQDNHILINEAALCIDSKNVERLIHNKCPYVAFIHYDKVYLSRVEWWNGAGEINYGAHGKQRFFPIAKMIHIHFDDYDHTDIGKWFARNLQGSAYAVSD